MNLINMCLYDAPKDVSLKILEISEFCEARNKLITMGIQTDDILVKLNNPSLGPVLIKNISNGANMLAIGKGLAKNIIVKHES